MDMALRCVSGAQRLHERQYSRAVLGNKVRIEKTAADALCRRVDGFPASRPTLTTAVSISSYTEPPATRSMFQGDAWWLTMLKRMKEWNGREKAIGDCKLQRCRGSCNSICPLFTFAKQTDPYITGIAVTRHRPLQVVLRPV